MCIRDRYFAQERYTEAENYYEKAIATVESCKEINQVWLAELLFWLACTQSASGKVAEARHACERALEIRIATYRAKANEVGQVLDLLGYVMRQGGELDLAEQHYKRALAIFQALGSVAGSRRESVLAD